MHDYEAQVKRSRERFVQETATHEMDVLRDDGVYRHIRFQRPGTSMYYFDLITWPGYLAVAGDCGDFLFSRVRDMFEFFRPSGARGGFEDERWGINPHYWAQKVRAGRDTVEQFSEDSFRAQVRQWHGDVSEGFGEDGVSGPFGGREALDLWRAIDEQILTPFEDCPTSGEAHRLLRDFEHDSDTWQGRIRIEDSWEWEFSEYDWQFLWCCWAIVWGIGRYDTAVTPLESAAA